ncbi:hypothetical protein [Pseudoduganella sp. HUAS MS19]
MKVLLKDDQVEASLRDYSAFLAADVSVATEPPPAFEVEFEAEGDAALDQYVEAGGKLECSKSAPAARPG